eukprot:scaffold2.g7431.t1
MGLVDTAIVGRLGTAPLAGVGVGTILMNFSSFLWNFLLYTTVPRIAAAAAKKDLTAVSKITAQGLWVATAIGCVTTTVLWFGCPAMFAAMGVAPSVAAQAVPYLRGRCVASPAVLAFFVLAGTFRGFKDTRRAWARATPLMAGLISNVVHVGLDVVLVFALGWGVVGAALATSLSHWLTLLILMGLVMQRGYLRSVDLRTRPRWAEVAPTMRNGLLLSTRSLLSMSMIMWATKLIAGFGAVGLAAHEILRQIWVVSNQLFTSLDIATQSLFAFYIGRNERRTAVGVFRRALALAVVAGVAVCGLLVARSTAFPAMFSRDPAVVAAAATALPLIAAFLPLDAAASVMDGVLLASQKAGWMSKIMIVAASICTAGLVLCQRMGWPLLAGVLLRDGRAIGRLVQPAVSSEQLGVQAPASVEQGEVVVRECSLAFHSYCPAARREEGRVGSAPQPLCLPVDEGFAESTFRVQVIGRQGASSFAVPHAFEASGRELATALSVEQQRLEYVRQHQQRRSAAEHALARQERAAPSTVTVSSGDGGLERLLSVFDVAQRPAWLKGLICKFLVAEATQSPVGAPLHAKERIGAGDGSSSKAPAAGGMQPEAYQIARSELGPAGRAGAEPSPRQQAPPSPAASVGRASSQGTPRGTPRGTLRTPRGGGRARGGADGQRSTSGADAQQAGGGTPGKKKKGKRKVEQPAGEAGAASAETRGGGNATGSPRTKGADKEALGKEAGALGASASGGSELHPAEAEAPAGSSSMAATPPRPPSAGGKRRGGAQGGERRRSEGGSRVGTPSGKKGGSRAGTPSKPPASPGGAQQQQQQQQQQPQQQQEQRRRRSRDKPTAVNLHPDLFPGATPSQSPTPDEPAEAAAAAAEPMGPSKPAAEGGRASTSKPPGNNRRASAGVRARQAVRVACPPGTRASELLEGVATAGVADVTSSLSPVASTSAGLADSPLLRPNGLQSLSIGAAAAGSAPSTPRSDGTAGADALSPRLPLPAGWPVPPGPSEFGVQYDFGQVSPLELSLDLPELPGSRATSPEKGEEAEEQPSAATAAAALPLPVQAPLALDLQSPCSSCSSGAAQAAAADGGSAACSHGCGAADARHARAASSDDSKASGASSDAPPANAWNHRRAVSMSWLGSAGRPASQGEAHAQQQTVHEVVPPPPPPPRPAASRSQPNLLGGGRAQGEPREQRRLSSGRLASSSSRSLSPTGHGTPLSTPIHSRSSSGRLDGAGLHVQVALPPQQQQQQQTVQNGRSPYLPAQLARTASAGGSFSAPTSKVASPVVSPVRVGGPGPACPGSMPAQPPLSLGRPVAMPLQLQVRDGQDDAPDLERFLKAATPLVVPPPSGPQDLTMAEVWRCFEAASLFGQEVATLGGPRGPSTAHFLPYLSAVHLFESAAPETEEGEEGDSGEEGEEGGSARGAAAEGDEGDAGAGPSAAPHAGAADLRPLLRYPDGLESWPPAMRPLVQWAESAHMGERVPLLAKLLDMCGAEGECHPLLAARIAGLHPYSWFAVAWYPLYRIPEAPLNARFLTFHTLGDLWNVAARAAAEQQAHAAADAASAEELAGGDAEAPGSPRTAAGAARGGPAGQGTLHSRPSYKSMLTGGLGRPSPAATGGAGRQGPAAATPTGVTSFPGSPTSSDAGTRTTSGGSRGDGGSAGAEGAAEAGSDAASAGSVPSLGSASVPASPAASEADGEELGEAYGAPPGAPLPLPVSGLCWYGITRGEEWAQTLVAAQLPPGPCPAPGALLADGSRVLRTWRGLAVIARPYPLARGGPVGWEIQRQAMTECAARLAAGAGLAAAVHPDAGAAAPPARLVSCPDYDFFASRAARYVPR